MIDEAEKALLESVSEEEAVDFLRAILRIPSLNRQEKGVAEEIGRRMENFGFAVQMQEPEPGRPTAIGKISGDGTGKSLILNGHTDHYPPSPDWPFDPYGALLKDGKIYGQGVNDMKCGLAAAIMAAKFVRDSNIKMRGDLYVMAIPGHFEGGVGTRYAVDRGLRADYALVCEPSDMKITVAQMGAVYFELVSFGVQAHTTGKDKGINAILKMIKTIDALQNLKLKYEKHKILNYDPILNIGTINGGIRHNIVPDRCTMRCDFRILPSQTPEGVKKEVEDMVERLKKEDPELNISVDYIEDWLKGPRLPSELSESDPFVEIVKSAIKKIKGSDRGVWGAPYWTDAAIFNEAHIKALSCGPGKEPYVWSGEYVEVAEYMDAIKTYMLIIKEICC